ncbi:MAG: GHKL domain-containing protein [Phycisphaerales bacterium]|nr:MAG: GHKL domain-containing protein [Phycisphaerales bacterium]
MRTRGQIESGSGQLRWVILLLSAAVILPTVCLLWFMGQAVQNVELAARQRLVVVYEEKLSGSAAGANESVGEQFASLDALVAGKGPAEVSGGLFRGGLNQVIVYDEAGERIYPQVSGDVNAPVEGSEEFAEGWRLEFEENEPGEALAFYGRKAQSADVLVRFVALIGKARCAARLGRRREAIDICREAALASEAGRCDAGVLMVIARARLLMFEWLAAEGGEGQAEVEERLRAGSKLVEIILNENEAGAVLPLDERVFLARRYVKSVGGGSDGEASAGIAENEQTLENLLDYGEVVLSVIERFPRAVALRDWPEEQFRQIQVGPERIRHGLRRELGGKTVLFLSGGDFDETLGDSYQRNFLKTGVRYRILDNLGRVVAGAEQARGRPFLKAPMGGNLTGWTAELYFEGADVFEKAAKRQIALYLWAGVLVMVLMLAAGGFATRAVGRQIRLNRLKNDFIATVSHELKTPLASMRVLVDTLLEGNYKDEQQAREYLELTARENERLSRLIDNFLTFSRMERNKQAFEIVRTGPGEIAEAAAEAVGTKFGNSKCELRVDIAEGLPEVGADRDAMVTVLVNLLDNACKYSYEDKRVELRVFVEGGSVCFSVRDNGIGMSQRAARKIFERFYQVDRSLSRRTEGCGLGLSIARFIVEAHKGSISVETAVGRGSTFTVRLPGAE